MSDRMVYRAGWGVADQALSSLTNFALGVLVARSATAAGFGAFSIVFASFALALGLSRAVSSEPLMVRYSVGSGADWRRGVAAATGTALSVGIILGLCCAATARIVGGALGSSLLALGVTLPGLLLQDCWRYAFFANGEGRKAFINDAVCASVLVVAFAALLSTSRPGIASLVLAWGAAATAGAVAGMAQSHTMPAPTRIRGWERQHRDLIPRYVGEFAVSSGAGQLSVFGVGLIAGLGTLGTLRAAYLLFGPLQVLFMGIGMVAVPELVRVLARSSRDLQVGSARLSATMGVVALLWGTAVVLTPASLGSAIVGPVWSVAHPLAIALTVGWMASGGVGGAAAGVRALAAAKRGLVVRVAGGVLSLVGAFVGVALHGAVGAAWGLALGASVECAFWQIQLARAVRDRVSIPGPTTQSVPFGVHSPALAEK